MTLMDDVGLEVMPDEMMEPLEEINPLQGFTYPGKNNETVSLDEAMQEWLVQRIRQQFDRFDKEKKAKQRMWRRTEKAVKGVASSIPSDRFNGLVPFGKQSLQTLISHFWGRSLQTPKILFNVLGNDDKSKELAPLQKELLLRLFRKDRLPQKLDDGIYEAIMKGVVIAYVGYEQRTQDFGAPIEHKKIVSDFNPNSAITTPDNGHGMTEFEQTVYDAASLRIIDPMDFVFDTDNHEKWDSCFKAFRCHEVYEDIADNPNYANFEGLEELSSEKMVLTSSNNIFSTKKKKEINTGVDENGRLEVIEFHGDIRLKDGTYLRNWTITIAGRKKVIRFERNPWYINPFVKWTYERTPDGWGISPLDYIIPFIDGGSMLMNTGIEAAKLSINPPWLAEKGTIPQKKQYLKEGEWIEYSPNQINPNSKPEMLQFNYQAPFPYIQLMESQSEATTGATRQLSGNVTTSDKAQTATEFQGLQVVGNLILDRLVDLFNLDFKIPIIEKMAKITAMFNPEAVNIAVENDKGQEEFKTATPDVYYGNYSYVIEDNKSENERKQNLQQEIGFLTQLAQDEEVGRRIKKVDAAQEVLRDMGWGAPAKVFMTDLEYIEDQLKKIAIAEFIGQLAQQMPLGQMAMANGGQLDPQMLANMALQVQAQAQGAVNAATGQTQGQVPGGATGSPADAAGIPGMENIQGVPPVPGGELASPGGI